MSITGLPGSDCTTRTLELRLRVQPLESGRVAVFSRSGDFVLLTKDELDTLAAGTQGFLDLDHARVAELYAKHIAVGENDAGMRRLLLARHAARHETVTAGPSLHILVPTLQCGHSCRYCQVSRALNAPGYEMSESMLDAACDTVFESSSPVLTIEFQGGDPLIRFDLVHRAIERIAKRNTSERRQIQFVVASTLHQLDQRMCSVFREHEVALSTSIDGPASLHNANRPLPSRDSFERTVAGIRMARELISPTSVSALVTTTKASLQMAEAIVDEYVRLGFDEIFVRPLAQHGFAKRNAPLMAYPSSSFHDFYNRCLDRVMWWNRKGIAIRETSAAIWFNKLLSPFDSGYVDLQNPTGAGSAVLVYNYDGYVYPSDEARMLNELGNTSLRLGRIGDPLRQLTRSEVVHRLRDHSNGQTHAECGGCPYNMMCGPDPVDAMTVDESVPVEETDHCKRSKWMFRNLLDRFDRATASGDEDFLDLAYAWARHAHPRKSGLNTIGQVEGNSLPLVGSVDASVPALTRSRFIPIRELKEDC